MLATIIGLFLSIICLGGMVLARQRKRYGIFLFWTIALVITIIFFGSILQ